MQASAAQDLSLGLASMLLQGSCAMRTDRHSLLHGPHAQSEARSPRSSAKSGSRATHQACMERLVSEFEMGVSGDAGWPLSRKNSSGVRGETPGLRLS